MAFFALLWKARTIEKYRINYETEKINSILSGHKSVEQTLSQRWRYYRHNTQKLITRAFNKWHPETTSVGKFLIYLSTDQTFPNFLLKSVMGFVGGIVLTYLCFMFFVFQLSISIIHATIMSSIIGVLLTLGLAFSYRVRCLVFLLIPQFFSRVGRYTLTCYALVLILTGPATNTLRNSEVLSESMACGQEQIKTSIHQLNDMMKKPYNSMRDSLKPIIDRLKIITEKVKAMVVRLDRLVLSIVSVVQSSFGWLQSITDICNARLGTPYERCLKMLSYGYADCKKSLTSEQDVHKYCKLDGMANAACHTVRPLKAFCYVNNFMDESVLASVKKNLGQFNEHLRAMFHVEVQIHHSYIYNSNSSRTASQVAAGIVTEIRNRADPLLTWLSWSSCVTSLFLLLIIFRAKYYQHMYETRSRFDNRYVTKELQELDLKRQRQGRSTVLPLNRRESAKYITTSSFRLVASEKVYLNRSAVFMAITTFKLLIHMVADYSLYWVLMTIRHHGQYQSDLIPGTPHSGVFISGKGFIARLFRSIVNTLDIPLAAPSPSPTPCLPDPYPPDLRRYTQIGVLIFLLWFFALFEPYGLRLRHLIMGHYRPERARARATWLYNHILRTRAGFMKFARRKLHREYKYCAKAPPTLRQWLDDHLPCKYLKLILGISPDDIQCLLCGITPRDGDPDSRLTKCQTPHCPGVYCISCFSDIGQLCTICLTPEDYGDLSDVSLEKGSDDSDSDQEDTFKLLDRSASRANLLQSARNNHTMETYGSTHRWKYFSKSGNYHYEEDAVAYIPSSSVETLEIVTQYFISGIRKLKCIRARTKKSFTSKWIAKLPPENIYEDFSTETYFEYYTNLQEFDDCSEFSKSFNMTKSIGVNTDKNRGFIVNALINTVRRQRVKRSRVYNTSNNKTIKDKFKDHFLPDSGQTSKRSSTKSKQLKTHDLKKVQRNLKKLITNKGEHKAKDKVFVCKEIKGVVKAMRFVIRSNEQIPVNNHSKEIVSSNPPTESTDEANKPSEETNQGGTQNKKSSKFNRSKRFGKKSGVKIKTKTKNSRHRLAEFHTFFSKHWASVKYSMIPCACADSQLVCPREKKNHKRRKKKKAGAKLDGVETEESGIKNENKQTRNIRLSAFLAELEWNKREYKNEQGDGPENTTLFLTDGAPRQPTATNKFIGMVQLKNMPFQWREESKPEICDCRDNKCSCQRKYKNYEQYINQSQKKPATHNTLDKLRLKVTKATDNSPTSFVKKMWSKFHVAFEKQPARNADASICISKRESYFRSCTNMDNIDEVTRLKTDTLFRNNNFYDDEPIETSSDELDLESSSRSCSTCQSSIIGTTQRDLVISCSSLFTGITSKKNKKSKKGKDKGRKRCKCDFYEDIQKKWAYVKNRFARCDQLSADKHTGQKSPGKKSGETKWGERPTETKWGEPQENLPNQSSSKPKAYCLSGISNKLVGLKNFASSLFGTPCTENTCPNMLEKKKEKEKEMKAKEKLKKKEDKKRGKKSQTATQTAKKKPKKKKAASSIQTQEVKDSGLQTETEQSKSTDTSAPQRKVITPSKHEKPEPPKKSKHKPQIRVKSMEKVVVKETAVATEKHAKEEKKVKKNANVQAKKPEKPPVKEPSPSQTSEVTVPSKASEVSGQSKIKEVSPPPATKKVSPPPPPKKVSPPSTSKKVSPPPTTKKVSPPPKKKKKSPPPTPKKKSPPPTPKKKSPPPTPKKKSPPPTPKKKSPPPTPKKKSPPPSPKKKSPPPTPKKKSPPPSPKKKSPPPSPKKKSPPPSPKKKSPPPSPKKKSPPPTPKKKSPPPTPKKKSPPPTPKKKSPPPTPKKLSPLPRKRKGPKPCKRCYTSDSSKSSKSSGSSTSARCEKSGVCLTDSSKSSKGSKTKSKGKVKSDKGKWKAKGDAKPKAKEKVKDQVKVKAIPKEAVVVQEKAECKCKDEEKKPKPQTKDTGVDPCIKEKEKLKKCEAKHSAILTRTAKVGNVKELRSAVVSAISPHHSSVVNISLETIKLNLDQQDNKPLPKPTMPYKSRGSSPVDEILNGDVKGIIKHFISKQTATKEVFTTSKTDKATPEILMKEQYTSPSPHVTVSTTSGFRKLAMLIRPEKKKSTKIYVTTKNSPIKPENIMRQAFTESKGINVTPDRKSGAYQAAGSPIPIACNRSVQYEKKYKMTDIMSHTKCNCDVNVGTTLHLCTCATQHNSVVAKVNASTLASFGTSSVVLNQCSIQDSDNKKSNAKNNKQNMGFGTSLSQHDESSHNRSSLYTPRRTKRQREAKAGTAKRRQSLSLEKSMCVLQRVAELSKEEDAVLSPLEGIQDTTMSESTESSVSSISLLTDDETRTDTTICSLATVNYDNRPRRRRYKARVVTKMNQSTLTDKTRLCDTGTITSDWWSPIVERKVIKPQQDKKKALIDKQKKEFELRKRKRNFGVTTDGKIVTFRSKTQIIPSRLFSGSYDIMSPSRYLLESQKYYNELFAYNCRRVPTKEYVASQLPKFQEREKTPRSTRRNHYRKTKRLDECYSPRRQISPRKRYADSTYSKTDSPRRRSSRYRTRHYPKSPRKKLP